MTCVIKQGYIRPFGSLAEGLHCLIEARLVDIFQSTAADERKAKRLQSFSDQVSVIPWIGQAANVLVIEVSDHQRHATLRLLRIVRLSSRCSNQHKERDAEA